MKSTAFAIATAAILGLSALSVPANALPAHPLAGSAAAASDVVDVRHYRGHRGHYHSHRVCKVRTIITRDRFGHRVVKKTRICRR